MDLASFVAQHGYWVVFLGALAEGESVLLLAGFAAHRGLLRLPEVIAWAFLAGSLGDQILFHIGRRHGKRLFARFPTVGRQAQRMRPLLARFPNASILSVRFLYGLRTAGPMALGALGVPRLKFTVLNLLGAAVWATAFGALGYQFGDAMSWLMHELRLAEEGALAVLCLAVLGWAVYRRLRRT